MKKTSKYLSIEIKFCLLIGKIDKFRLRPKVISLINTKQSFEIFAQFCKIIAIEKVQSIFQSFYQSLFNQQNVDFKLKEVSEEYLVHLKLSCKVKIFFKFQYQVNSIIACKALHLKLKFYKDCGQKTYKTTKKHKINIQKKNNNNGFFTSPVTIAANQLYEGYSSFNWLNRFITKTFICTKEQ